MRPCQGLPYAHFRNITKLYLPLPSYGVVRTLCNVRCNRPNFSVHHLSTLPLFVAPCRGRKLSQSIRPRSDDGNGRTDKNERNSGVGGGRRRRIDFVFASPTSGCNEADIFCARIRMRKKLCPIKICCKDKLGSVSFLGELPQEEICRRFVVLSLSSSGREGGRYLGKAIIP
jgi:hypothetical protein